MMLKQTLSSIYHWLLPPTCLLCQQPADNTIDLCSACILTLPWLEQACYRCALPLASTNDQLCGACLKKPPPYERTIVLCRYQTPIDQWILALKFHDELIYAKLLGKLLAQQLQSVYVNKAWPELIIPVPLHRQRLIERGYNQTVEIAKELCKELKILLDRRSCERVRATKPQLTLPAKQRQRNVRGAFILKQPLPAEHVAIVDDVVTTGSTIKELSSMLLKNGVKRVDIWCIARA